MQFPLLSFKQSKIVKISRSTLIEVISGLFILLFVYTAFSKFSDLERFKYFLTQSPLVGGMSKYVAWTIPSVEVIISILLFIPKTRKAGMWSSFLLMIAFTGYLGYMIATMSNLPCSCGGVISEMTWRQHLVFNSGFTLLGLLGIYLIKKEKYFRMSSGNQI
jgi:uncharacterized membrane protein